eukprot:1159557-Pelagomonas_calceolata.AAC.17
MTTCGNKAPEKVSIRAKVRREPRYQGSMLPARLVKKKALEKWNAYLHVCMAIELFGWLPTPSQELDMRSLSGKVRHMHEARVGAHPPTPTPTSY